MTWPIAVVCMIAIAGITIIVCITSRWTTDEWLRWRADD